MKHIRITVPAILAALAIPALAADEHKHGDKHKDHPKTEVKIPESADALWAEIDAKAKELADLITAKKGDGVPATAETIEALVAAVPAKHGDLAADKKKRVEGMAKNVARTLDGLHEEAEEGHWDDAGKRLAQIQGALKLMKQQVGK